MASWVDESRRGGTEYRLRKDSPSQLVMYVPPLRNADRGEDSQNLVIV